VGHYGHLWSGTRADDPLRALLPGTARVSPLSRAWEDEARLAWCLFDRGKEERNSGDDNSHGNGRGRCRWYSKVWVRDPSGGVSAYALTERPPIVAGPTINKNETSQVGPGIGIHVATDLTWLFSTVSGDIRHSTWSPSFAIILAGF
jgi:hypothetical protein